MKLLSRLSRLGCGASVVLAFAFTLATAATAGYHLLTKYSFGAAEGSTREYFDYITVDSAARRVYLSHGTEIKVIDADTGRLIGNITGLKKDHGVAIASEFGRGFITDGAEGKVIIFDLNTLQVTGEAKADSDADSVVYDSFSKRVFAQNGDPNSSTVIDARSGAVVGTIKLVELLNSPSPTGRGRSLSIWKTKARLSPLIPRRSPSGHAGRLRRRESRPPLPWTSSTAGCSAPAAVRSCWWRWMPIAGRSSSRSRSQREWMPPLMSPKPA